jgi:hypothetical protein
VDQRGTVGFTVSMPLPPDRTDLHVIVSLKKFDTVTATGWVGLAIESA